MDKFSKLKTKSYFNYCVYSFFETVHAEKECGGPTKQWVLGLFGLPEVNQSEEGGGLKRPRVYDLLFESARG